MNSKEALKQYKEIYVDKTLKFEFQPPQECYLDIIEQDLDRLEKLEKENQELLVNKNVAQGIATKFKEENDRLKKAFDKAIEKCMKFDKCPPITCIEITKVINDDNVCKECWKNYFMKEVLSND